MTPHASQMRGKNRCRAPNDVVHGQEAINDSFVAKPALRAVNCRFGFLSPLRVL